MEFLFYTLLVSSLSTVAASQCPPTFQQNGTSCYKIMGILASWIEAKQYCNVMGADLAVIEDAGEEKFLEDELRKIHGAGNVGPENYWIDGADFMEKNVWRWMRNDGGSYFIKGYTNWAPGQPDDIGEHCLEIRYSFGIHWNNFNCFQKENFICEVSAELDGGNSIIG
uniref:C-type lectin 3 n=1 Tax=Anadara kagoshimensis TaxID=1390362 RepID=A0A7G7XXY5_9BIVA|nr:C-type lectin 3 [Anadara sativa]